MCAAVIWDLDGTLSDSLQLGYQATKYTLLQHGLEEITIDDYKYGTRYPTIQRMAWHATGSIENEIGIQLAREFDDYYVELVNNQNTALYSGVITMLDHFYESKQSIKMSILSNACSEYVQRVVQVNHIQKYFISCYGIEDVAAGKPHPDGLEKIIAELGVNKSASIYIGDSPTDGQAARACGVHSIGVSWGNCTPELLRGNLFLRPNFHFLPEHFNEMVSTIEELTQALDRFLLSHRSTEGKPQRRKSGKDTHVQWEPNVVDNEHMNKLRTDNEFWDR